MKDEEKGKAEKKIRAEAGVEKEENERGNKRRS